MQHPAREYLELARSAQESIVRTGPTEKNQQNLLVAIYRAQAAIVEQWERDNAKGANKGADGVVAVNRGKRGATSKKSTAADDDVAIDALNHDHAATSDVATTTLTA